MLFPMVLELPQDIAGGLATGRLVRRGGVIQRAADSEGAGEIVMWLREAAIRPAPAETLVPAGPLPQLLNLVGSTASILNLGATTAFGVATLRKLGALRHELETVRTRVEQIAERMERLQTTVELGFVGMQAAMEDVSRQIREDGVLRLKARLQAAEELAWQSNLMAGSKRESGLVLALRDCEAAAGELLLRLEDGIEPVVERFAAPARRRLRFEHTLQALPWLHNCRLAVLAVSLRTSLRAEIVGSDAAAQGVARDHRRLEALVGKLSGSFVFGRPSEPKSIYRYLLHQDLAAVFPARRAELWIRRYSPEVGGLAGLYDRLRREGDFDPRTPGELTEAAVKGLPVFADALDGATEDLDRLAGQAAEHRAAAAMGMEWNAYRSALAVPDDADVSRRLVLFAAPTRTGG